MKAEQAQPLSLFFKTHKEIKTLRQNQGLSQTMFWGRIGVLQAVGSHYETGRYRPPDSVLRLLHLAYGEEDAAHELLKWLRASHGVDADLQG